jgi:hypothetical protein
MDMMPPICDCWRRAIHQKNPMMIRKGRNRGRRFRKKLPVGVSKTISTLLVSMMARCSSGMGLGPVVWNVSPSTLVPVIRALVLSYSIDATSPFSISANSSE